MSLFQIIHPINPSSCGKKGAGHKNVCISKTCSARLKRHCPRWWFQIFFKCSLLFGEDSHFHYHFSGELKPPTDLCFKEPTDGHLSLVSPPRTSAGTSGTYAARHVGICGLVTSCSPQQDGNGNHNLGK